MTISTVLATCAAMFIADDPYQYEQWPTKSLIHTYERLCTRQQWRPLEGQDLVQFQLLSCTMKQRASIGSVSDRAAVIQALASCS